MKHLIDYVRGYLTKNEGNIEPIWNMDDSDFESDFEEGLEIKSKVTPSQYRHLVAIFSPGFVSRLNRILKLMTKKNLLKLKQLAPIFDVSLIPDSNFLTTPTTTTFKYCALAL